MRRGNGKHRLGIAVIWVSKIDISSKVKEDFPSSLMKCNLTVMPAYHNSPMCSKACGNVITL